MSKKTMILIIIIIIVIAGFGVMSRDLQNDLQTPESVPDGSVIPPQAPKTFKFDSSTDLKKELESINPEIQDDDFQNLKN